MGNLSRSSPQLAWMDGVREVSFASQDAQVIVCFPSSRKQWQVCLHYACVTTSLGCRQVTDRCVGWFPTGPLPPVLSLRERRPADRPGLNSGSSETDPNLRDLECLGQGCHNSTQSRVVDDRHN